MKYSQTVIIYDGGYLFNSCLCMKPVAMSLLNSDLYICAMRWSYSHIPQWIRFFFYLHFCTNYAYLNIIISIPYFHHMDSWVHIIINQQHENELRGKFHFRKCVIDQHFTLMLFLSLSLNVRC